MNQIFDQNKKKNEGIKSSEICQYYTRPFSATYVISVLRGKDAI